MITEQITEDDDIGHPPHEIKEQWPQVDWSFFPDEPEVWWYPGPNVSDLSTQTMETQRQLYLESPWIELWINVLQRASKFEAWLQTRSEGHICVVSHGGFISALVGKSLGNAEQCFLDLTLEPNLADSPLLI
jgi:broad specificity phosphatase PhoE